MKAASLRRLRQWHLYLGMIFAPMILLFAISGALQTFRLHEESGWGGAKPPSWMVWMASVHRDDRLPQHEAAKSNPDHKAMTDKPKAPRPKPLSRLLLQIFSVLLSVGLTISAVLGIVIALNSRATRGVSLLMLAVGTALPLLLLYA